MFKAVKLTTLVYVLCGVVLAATLPPAFVLASRRTEANAVFSQKARTVVVIDAGHGGDDPGVTGVRSGVKESDLNLKTAIVLGDLLSSAGYKAVQTRLTEGSTAEGAFDKDADMRARKQVIERAEPAAVVSLHMNKYEDPSRRGVQIFYTTDASAALAAQMQKHLNDTMNLPTLGRGFEPIRGDYYIAKCTDAPSIIIECAFLSNPIDESLITDANYRLRLAGEIETALNRYLTERESAGA